MDFSERLKNLRKQANFTQVEVAEKLGISQPAYASWERSVTKPTQDLNPIEQAWAILKKKVTDLLREVPNIFECLERFFKTK